MHLAVGQNEWDYAPPVLVYFSGDWDVHWGYGSLTHHVGAAARHGSESGLALVFGRKERRTMAQRRFAGRLGFAEQNNQHIVKLACLGSISH